MTKKYRSSSQPTLKVEELPPVPSTLLKNATADVLDQVASQGAVAITRHDKPRAVLLSIEEYERMTGAESHILHELQAEYRSVLEEMQTPEQKEAAKRLFEATPEELGTAAVRRAQRKGKLHP